MQIIPLQAVPSQQFSISLDGQSCVIAVYQKGSGVYMDLQLNGVPVTYAVRCLNCARLLEDRQYAGFVGDLMFVDTTASVDPLDGEDPVYTGFGAGAQFQLWYLEAADIVAFPE
jgi:hypothetical protein